MSDLYRSRAPRSSSRRQQQTALPAEITTPVAQAFSSEYQAAAEVNKQAEEQDLIKQQQEAEQERQQINRQSVATAKKVGQQTQTDPLTGAESVKKDTATGKPIWEAGFIGDPTPDNEGKIVVPYRFPDGRTLPVPLDRVNKKTEKTGENFLEFDYQDETGNVQRIRRPEDKTKPLFQTDEATGQRYRDVPDAAGSMVRQPLGIDPVAANQARINKRKEAYAKEKEALKFQDDKLVLETQGEELKLKPIKEKLTEAEKLAKQYAPEAAKDKSRYELRPDGYYRVDGAFGDLPAIPRKLETPDEIASANNWLKQKEQADKQLQGIKAEHDPIKQRLNDLEKKKYALAKQTLAASERAQTDMADMEIAALAGLDLSRPQWKQVLDIAKKDEHFQKIMAAGEAADQGSLLADAIASSLSRHNKKVEAHNAAIDFDQVWARTMAYMDGKTTPTMKEEHEAAQVQAEHDVQTSLVDMLASGVRGDKGTVDATDQAKATEIATKSLGVQDPENWSLSPDNRGNYNLHHTSDEAPLGWLDTKNMRVMLFPSATVTDAGQQLLEKASADGFPVFHMGSEATGGGVPMTHQELRDYVAKGVEIARSAATPDEKEALLAKEGITPTDIREQVMAGRMSVQDGRWLNEKLFEEKELDNSPDGYAKGFADYLSANPAQAKIMASGTREQKLAVANNYSDARAGQSAGNMFYQRDTLADRRVELAQKVAPTGKVEKLTTGAKQILAPMVGLLAQMPAWAFQEALKRAGSETEAGRLADEQFGDWQKRTSGFFHRINARDDVTESLTEFKQWANRARPGEQPPDELANKVARSVFDGYHQLTEESARDLNTSLDTFNVNKDPKLQALLQRYLTTSDPSAFEQMASMMVMDGKDRKTQAEVMKYIERPRAATPELVADRAKELGLNIQPGAAPRLLEMATALGNSKDAKQYQSIVAQAGKMLGTSTESDTIHALQTITTEATDDPDSWWGLTKGGFVAGRQEAVTELLSTAAEGGLAMLTGGAATPEILAGKAARRTMLSAGRAALKRTATAALDALADESKLFAATRAGFNRGRAKLGSVIAKDAEAFAKEGITTPKFGVPLTAGQKLKNAAVTVGKTAAAAAPIEATEEGVAAIGDVDPTIQGTIEQMGMGAIGAGLITPIFLGAATVRNVFQARKAEKMLGQAKAKWVEKFNERHAKVPGFKPITVAQYDVWSGTQDNPAHKQGEVEYQSALAEKLAAYKEAESTPVAGPATAAPPAPQPTPGATPDATSQKGQGQGQEVLTPAPEATPVAEAQPAPATTSTLNPAFKDLSDEELSKRIATAERLSVEQGRTDQSSWKHDAELMRKEQAARSSAQPPVAVNAAQAEEEPVMPPDPEDTSNIDQPFAAPATRPLTPRQIAADARLEAAIQNLAGLSQIAFSASEEIFALPEADRPLYTAVAKAKAGSTIYTADEAKALIKQNGANAVTFQKAEILPPEVQGPRNLKTLSELPDAIKVGPALYRLPEGVQIAIPDALTASVVANAPSLGILLQTSAQAQAAAKPTVSPEYLKQWEQFGTVKSEGGAVAVTSDTRKAHEAAMFALKQAGIRPNKVVTGPGADGKTAYTILFDAPKASVTSKPTVNRKTQRETDAFASLGDELRAKMESPDVYDAEWTQEEIAAINTALPDESPFNQALQTDATNIPTDEAPAKRNEVLSIAHDALAGFLKKNPKLEDLVQFSFYVEHDGGMQVYNPNTDPFIRVNLHRLANNIWIDGQNNGSLTRAQAAEAAIETLRHEVEHVADLHAAKTIYEKLTPDQRAKEIAKYTKSLDAAGKNDFTEQGYVGWRRAYYSNMWNGWTPEQRQAIIDTYGDALLDRPDWIKGMEGSRMAITMKNFGFISEAVIRHVQAFLKAIKELITNPSAAFAKHIEEVEKAMAKLLGDTAEVSNDTKAEETPEITIKVKKDGETEVRTLAFADPQDAAVFDIADKYDSLNKEADPQNRKKLVAEINAFADALAAKLTADGTATTRQKLLGTDKNGGRGTIRAYADRVRTQAIEGNTLDPFTPQTFDSYTKHGNVSAKPIEEKKQAVRATRWADNTRTNQRSDDGQRLISKIKRVSKGIGEPTTSAEWTWFRSLAQDAARMQQDTPRSVAEIRAMAEKGETEDPRAAVWWIIDNLMQWPNGRPQNQFDAPADYTNAIAGNFADAEDGAPSRLDEISELLRDQEQTDISAADLGAAILEDMNAANAAAQKNLDDQAEAEGEEVAAAEDEAAAEEAAATGRTKADVMADPLIQPKIREKAAAKIKEAAVSRVKKSTGQSAADAAREASVTQAAQGTQQQKGTPEQRQDAIQRTYGTLSENVQIINHSPEMPHIMRGRGLLVNIDDQRYVAMPQVAFPSVVVDGMSPRGKRVFPLAGDKSNWVSYINARLNETIPDLDDKTDVYVEPYGGGLTYLQNLSVLKNTKKRIIIYVARYFEPERFAIYSALKERNQPIIDDIRQYLKRGKMYTPKTEEAVWAVRLLNSKLADDSIDEEASPDMANERPRETLSDLRQTALNNLDALIDLISRGNVELKPQNDDAAFAEIAELAESGLKVTLFDDSNYADLPFERTADVYKTTTPEQTAGLQSLGPVRGEVPEEIRSKNAVELAAQKKPTYDAVLGANGTIIATNNMAPELLNPLLADYGQYGQWFGYNHSSQNIKDLEYVHYNGRPVSWQPDRPEYLAIVRTDIENDTTLYGHTLTTGPNAGTRDYGLTGQRRLDDLNRETPADPTRPDDQRTSTGAYESPDRPAPNAISRAFDETRDAARAAKRAKKDVDAGPPLFSSPATLRKLSKQETSELSDEYLEEAELLDAIEKRDPLAPYRLIRYWNSHGFAEIASNDTPAITNAFIDAVMHMPVSSLKQDIFRYQGYQTQEERDAYLKNHKPGTVIEIKRPVNAFSNWPSMGKELAEAYGGDHMVEFKISNPKAVRDFNDIFASTSAGTEVLYPRGSQFTVKSISKVANPTKWNSKPSKGSITTVELEEASIPRIAEAVFSSPAQLRAEILESHKGYISPKFKGTKAWLTPDGRWINVTEHYELAPPDFWETNKGFDRDLTGEAKAAGFARIVYDRNSGQLISEHDNLTQSQRSELKNTATELFADLVYDRGGLFSAPAIPIVERGQALFSAPARGYESMTFDPPFKTSFGDIVSYDWMSKPVGGMTSQQVSDWNQARTNPVTGRPIVHHFRVRGPDGMATVSLETALGRLSPPDRSKLSGMIRTEQRRRQEEASGQITLFSSPISYASGIETPTDATGALQADVPVGTTAQAVTKSPALKRIFQNAINRGVKVFVDSGAFTAYTKNRPALDFDAIFDTYDTLAGDRPIKNTLTVVGPDVLGDQEKSATLVRRYAGRINRLIDKGVRVILPIQSGSMTMEEYLKEVGFPPSRVAVGVPANKAAYPRKLLRGHLQQAMVQDVHFLGMSASNKDASELTQAAKDSGVQRISMDANRIRSHAGRAIRKPGKDDPARTDLRTELEHEAYSGLHDLTDAQKRDIVENSLVMPLSSLEEESWSSVLEAIDAMRPGYLEKWLSDNLGFPTIENQTLRQDAIAKALRKDAEAVITRESAAQTGTLMPDGAVLSDGPGMVQMPLFAAPIRAYHGTPHKVDEFSLDKIGTGEGAQVYGYGLYLAESLEVADSYRASLSRGTVPSTAYERLSDAASINIEKLGEFAITHPALIKSLGSVDVETRRDVLAVMRGLLKDREIGRAIVRLLPVDMMNMLGGKKWTTNQLLHNPSVLENLLSIDPNNPITIGVKAVDKLAGFMAYAVAEHPLASADLRGKLQNWSTASGTRESNLHGEELYPRHELNTGNLYTVEILGDQDEFLDWDKPLSEQPSITSAIRERGTLPIWDELLAGNFSGADAYRKLRNATGDPATASRVLNTLGIKGIRYLDDGSRRFTPQQDKRTNLWSVHYGQANATSRWFKTQAEAEQFADTMRTRNFVIFDDALIRIIEENGKPAEQSGLIASSPAEQRSQMPTADAQTIVANLDKVQAVRPLNAQEAADYAKAKAVVDGSAPEELMASPATDKQADMRQALDTMPPIWRDVLESSMAGQDADTIAARLNIPTEAVGNIQRVAEARLRILLDAAAGKLKPSVQPVQDNWYEPPTLKATAGRPDLALSGIPAVTAVDQRRAGPEEVTHAEMQTMANRMFALDLPATERMLKAWMESGGMAIDTEAAPDGIKDIVKAANARQAGHMLMTAAAKLMVTRYALTGTNMLETANLIDLYRNTGTEQARALNMRRDPHQSPAERAAMFIQEALLTPPQAVQNEIAKNPGNKAAILSKWVERAQRIKRELIAEGYDIDATFQQFHVEQQLADAVVPESVQPTLEQADPATQRVVRSILEGDSWAEAARNAGTPIATAREAYNAFRNGVRDAYQAFKKEFLGASPADQISLLGLPEWTVDANPDAVPVQTAATKALKQHRSRRKTGGEFDLHNPLAVNRVERAVEMRKATGFDKLSEFWRASILTGPQTHIVNIVSGMTYGAYEATVKKVGAGALADIARMFGMKPDAASLSDLPAMLSATLPAVRQAFVDAMRSFQFESRMFDSYAEGQSPTAKNSNLFKEQYQPALKGTIGTLMRGASFRLMGAADEFVKSFFTRIEVAAQARQIARAQGHKGIALANAISEQMQPGSLAWLRALEHAKKITFQQKLGSTEDTISKLDGLAKIINNTKQGQFGGMPKALSHFIFPFVDTPTNIFKQAATISPLGGLLAIVDATQALRRLKQGNKEQAAKLYNAARALSDLTNQIVAWGAVLAIAEMVKPGDDDDKTPFITGTIPWRAVSKGEREIAYRTAPPQSIRIGDKWYSYRRLDPFATALAFVVDSIRDLQSGKPADEILPKIGVNMLHNLQDKTFLQGISDFMNAVQDPNRFGTKWATNIATGFMPNLVRQSIRSGDDVFRETDLPNDMPFWDVLGRRIGFGMYPVGSDDSMLPRNPLAPLPATDVWGRPASKNTGTGGPNTDFLLRLFSPVDTRDTTNVDPLDVRLLRWNMANPDDAFAMTAPTREIKRTINGKPVSVSLSDAEHADLTTKSGQAARQAIGNRYNDRDLTKEDVKQIRQVTDKAHDMFRELAFRKHYKP